MEHETFKTSINPGFWNKLTELKLNVDKLNQTKRFIWGYFTIFNQSKVGPIFEVDSTSFNQESGNTLFGYLSAPGTIHNKNTIEEFKDCNKSNFICEEGDLLWKNIKNGNCLEDPSLLNAFTVLSFADLKKYQYYYWFCFPSPPEINYDMNISKPFIVDNEHIILENYLALETKQRHFFVLKPSSGDIITLKTYFDSIYSRDGKELNDYWFCFSDPSSNKNQPGWVLKNYILCLLYYCAKLRGAKSALFVSFRLTRTSSRDGMNVPSHSVYNSKPCTLSESIIFDLNLTRLNDEFMNEFLENRKASMGWIGWERNERGKMGPRLANMKTSIDPKCLSESSVDLNLKLMKWRLSPDLDLDKIKNMRCLLLGAGTLGCSVARVLLGWGVRHITFVDNGTVSYSNPVRQSLFTYEDAKGSKPKALTAASRLRDIFPGVISSGYDLSIPMPGHPFTIDALDSVRDCVKKLENLIREHDTIFLLTDSRESRWLPTVLYVAETMNRKNEVEEGAEEQSISDSNRGKAKKIAITAALGFDTYLIIRHGFGLPQTYNSVLTNITENHLITTSRENDMRSIPGDQLGCYFCNDITAPGNSLKDRSLDQQCTVTRPGVSQIAGAYAAELMIALTQHSFGSLASAYYKSTNSDQQSSLSEQFIISSEFDEKSDAVFGPIPHSLRGFLSTYGICTPATQRHQKCVACSQKVISEYFRRGFAFLEEVFNGGDILEQITGLKEEMANIDMTEVWELEESDENTD